jgi:hypothetical protein
MLPGEPGENTASLPSAHSGVREVCEINKKYIPGCPGYTLMEANMVYYELSIRIGLFNPEKTFSELAPTMDSYRFTGASIAELRAKIARVFGNDRSWVDNTALDLYYQATYGNNNVALLNCWTNTIDHDRFNELLFGEA